mmetsp:Transcript_33255/g.42712  ORF Transcript_33255/g.42712 Transcript_33255/m.42712 type:complete len:287 (+) Transcript_33255:55-915(+)
MEQISSCLSILRRMPPNEIEQNLENLLDLNSEIEDELLQRVDQPLKEAIDPTNGKKYLLCDYNRDGDSYRSPWSNTYSPPLPDGGFVPSERVRALEVEANELLEAYCALYYDQGEGALSSAYLWDQDQGFAACFLIKNQVTGHQYVREGCWEAFHVVSVAEDRPGGQATYKLTTSVRLSMGVNQAEVGETDLSGALTKQAELTAPVNPTQSHLMNIGHLIEETEIELRTNMDSLYIQKTREIVDSLRTSQPQASPQKNINAHAALLAQAIAKRTPVKDAEQVHSYS